MRHCTIEADLGIAGHVSLDITYSYTPGRPELDPPEPPTVVFHRIDCPPLFFFKDPGAELTALVIAEAEAQDDEARLG